jgi:hypothetical protein
MWEIFVERRRRMSWSMFVRDEIASPHCPPRGSDGCVAYEGSNATLRSIPITCWRGEAFTSAECHDLIVQPFKIVRHVE